MRETMKLVEQADHLEGMAGFLRECAENTAGIFGSMKQDRDALIAGAAALRRAAESLSHPATGRRTREEVARIVDPWAFDVRIGEMGTGRPDQRPHYREAALAKADQILSLFPAGDPD